MNKGAGFILAIFGLVILMSGLSVATYSPNKVDSGSIQTNYPAGANLKGIITLNFSQEPADSFFTSNLNDASITLIDLIRANNLAEGSDYKCDYANCEPRYKASTSPLTNKSLSNATPLFAGFAITGNNVEVSSLDFSVNSNAGDSCTRQLLIDALGKNESFIQSNKYSEDALCEERNYGCFNSAASTSQAIITRSPYCEKINLDSAPSYRIGASISGSSTNAIKMSLLTLEGSELGNCILEKTNSLTEELSCTLNYTIVNKGEYLVCINSYSDSSGLKIAKETAAPVCGGAFGQNYNTTDFYIFARPLKFAAIETIGIAGNFKKQNPDYSDLASYVNDYIVEKYNKDCSGKCIIPFKFSGIQQNLTFSGISINFVSDGVSTEDNNLYELRADAAKLTTLKPVNLEMNYAGFEIPASWTGTKNAKIYYKGNEILSKSISVAPSFSFGISPVSVLFGIKTDFQAIVSANISSSSWNFGDGTPVKTSFGKSVSHRYTDYNADGYQVDVGLIRSDGVKAAGSFKISFGSLSESATKILNEYELLLANLSKKINSFDSFIATNLRKSINITQMQNALNSTKSMLSAGSDSLDVINSALAINPPALLDVSEKGTGIPFAFGFESMNVKYITKISKANASSEEELKKAIAAWFGKNYDAVIDYKVISKTNEDGAMSPVLTYFKIIFTKKEGADKSANNTYLIINYPIEGISFAGSYSARQVDSGICIPITDSATIEFSVSEEVGVSNLGMYLSPTIDKIGAVSGVKIASKKGFIWGRFLLWGGILLVLAIIIYTILQQWYKKRYESYLFRNSHDLYNIMNFIHHSRKGGFAEGEISKKLKKAGWRGEQIVYAFRKIDGKSIGMPALPFMRLFERKKVIDELEKKRNIEQAIQPRT